MLSGVEQVKFAWVPLVLHCWNEVTNGARAIIHELVPLGIKESF